MTKQNTTHIPVNLPTEALAVALGYATHNLNWDGDSEEKEEMAERVTEIADMKADPDTGKSLLPLEAWEEVASYCYDNLDWDSDSEEKDDTYKALGQIEVSILQAKYGAALATPAA